MITRYLVELDAGGELQVVRQNLERPRRGRSEQAGREVVVGGGRSTRSPSGRTRERRQ